VCVCVCVCVLWKEMLVAVRIDERPSEKAAIW
jgi:hypothetical protein